MKYADDFSDFFSDEMVAAGEAASVVPQEPFMITGWRDELPSWQKKIFEDILKNKKEMFFENDRPLPPPVMAAFLGGYFNGVLQRIDFNREVIHVPVPSSNHHPDFGNEWELTQIVVAYQKTDLQIRTRGHWATVYKLPDEKLENIWSAFPDLNDSRYAPSPFITSSSMQW